METSPKPDKKVESLVQIYIDFNKVVKGVDIIPKALKELPQDPEYLDIKPGICLIVGPNGSGKTTLATGLYYAASGKSPHGDIELLEKIPALYFSRGIELGGSFEYVMQFDAAVSKRGGEHAGPHETLSNRQARDYEFGKVMNELKSLKDPKPVLIIIDEPEAGMDPWRHENLGKELEDILISAPEGSAVLVATNSPLLVLKSNYPRIDLRNPQSGVQTP